MLKRVLGCLLLAACANAGDPPGGPPDTTPPTIVALDPDSGQVLAAPPHEASIVFDEVISERIQGGATQDIRGAVVLSPDDGETRVSWQRDRLGVRPRRGFKPNRVYRIELLPVLTDLRTNRLRTGKVIVFSTGPAIPSARISGTVVDWVNGRSAPRALIEAVLMPDSLPYRTLADSGGVFSFGALPAGQYLVYGVVDANGDHRRGPREAFDTATVALDTAAALEFYAFAHDTTGPRVRQIESADSLTLRLTFDKPLDPLAPLDTSAVHVAPYDDSTNTLPLVGVFTQKQADSVAAAARDSAAATARRGDTSAARRDTTRRDTAAARPRLEPAPRAPLDSTRADRMLARRPPPTPLRLVRLAAPLQVQTRYLVFVKDARSISGYATPLARGQITLPRPPPPRPRPPGRDSARADSTRRDSTARDTSRVRRP